jgi:TPP-dependent 2-oxoacid decarboxylase
MTSHATSTTTAADRAGTYTVADHLLDRLAEMGVDRVFGVPGDFTLSLLDHVVAHPAIAWTGCTNELNAGYAADGYARVRGAGALMTTFGVGELSAVNAVAGSFAEHVPVVHIVGAPSTAAQLAHRRVHHTLGDGDFGHFAQMHAHVTCAQAVLSAEDAPGEIDRVLSTVREGSLPGYLLLPVDVAEAPCAPPSAPLPPPRDLTDPAALTAFRAAAEELLRRADSAGGAALLAGVLVHRFGGAPQLRQLLRAAPVPHATTLWGKSVVDESDERYLGVYAGAASEASVRAAIEDAGALVVAGVEFTDLNSGFFSHHLHPERTIEIRPRWATVGGAAFEPIALPAALGAVADALQLAARATAPGPVYVTADRAAAPAWTDDREPSAPRQNADPGTRSEPRADADLDASGELDQLGLWGAVAAHIRPGDIVLADQGTSFYGMAVHRLPAGVTFLGQPLWASIGYTLPAMLGACLAQPGRRGVLLIGDGAAQMTVQELSMIAALGLDATVIVVDNDGYTVERAIHGPAQPYNDIAQWDWTALPSALAPGRAVRAHRVRTREQLAGALGAADGSAPGLTLIQAIVPRMDVPDLLAALAAAAAAANSQPAGQLHNQPAGQAASIRATAHR